MLRILRQDIDAHNVVLVLLGRVVSEWVDVLERECFELSRSGVDVALDLSGVTFIGRLGLETLGRLVRSGIRIIGCPPLLSEVLRQDGIDIGLRVRDRRHEN